MFKENKENFEKVKDSVEPTKELTDTFKEMNDNVNKYGDAMNEAVNNMDDPNAFEKSIDKANDALQDTLKSGIDSVKAGSEMPGTV